jgi:hypothetical protein
MSEEAKKKRNEYMKNYMRDWRRKNPDKVQEIVERYWTRKANEITEMGNNR